LIDTAGAIDGAGADPALHREDLIHRGHRGQRSLNLGDIGPVCARWSVACASHKY
jgi:hypothetical protein